MQIIILFTNLNAMVRWMCYACLQRHYVSQACVGSQGIETTILVYMNDGFANIYSIQMCFNWPELLALELNDVKLPLWHRGNEGGLSI